jgi:hypothetical protein
MGTKSSPSTLQALTRALNSGGRMLEGAAGVSLVRLDETILLEEAARRARSDDFGDESFREPLRRLLAAYENDAQLSLLGRIAARQDMIRLLANRARLRSDRRRHPEIAAEAVRRPLFVTGLPRTGTTLLHGLLAQDPVTRAPRHWECVFPTPPPERARYTTDRRIAAAARQLRWFHRMNPEIRKIHAVGAQLPEECLIITSHSFLSFQFQTSHQVASYQAWLEAQDLRPSYVEHLHFLQHLQSRCRGERWALKAPAHLYGIDALFAVYPDAGVVFTHREPLEVVASAASLHTVLRSTFSDGVDPIAVGREVTTRWCEGMRRALAARDGGCAPSERFFDVRYTDLMRNPIGVVRGIYAHFDMRFSEAAEHRMRRFLAENPKDKHGRHEYTLEEFGLDRDQERQRYAWYRDRFEL